jgi:hypothetical protein
MGIVVSLIIIGEYISGYCKLKLKSVTKKIMRIEYLNKSNIEDNICTKCDILYPKLFTHCCDCRMSWQFMDRHCCYCKKTFFLPKKKNHICIF